MGIQVFSCGGKGKNIPDVSDIEVDFTLKRFDQALFSLDTTQVEFGMQQLHNEYPDFAPIFFNNIIGATDLRMAPEGPEPFIRGFISDERVRHLYDTCQVVFSDMEDIRSEFEQAFKFYRYYFPGKPTPDVVSFFSEFGFGSLIYGEDKLAFGVDFFLGAGFSISGQ